MKQAISILLRKQDDSLVRLTGLFYRRGYVVESLSAVPTYQQGHVRVTAVISGYNNTLGQLQNYIGKLVDVVAVDILEANQHTETEGMICY